MMDETNCYEIETRDILHPHGWQETISMERWYWEALDWIVNDVGTSMKTIFDFCENYREHYELDYALRYYIQEYVDRYERAAAAA